MACMPQESVFSVHSRAVLRLLFCIQISGFGIFFDTTSSTQKVDPERGNLVIKQKLFCVDHNPDDVFVRLFHCLIRRGAGWAGSCSHLLTFDMGQRDF